MSEGKREYWNNTKHRAHQSEVMREAMLERWCKPEFRAAMLETLKVARSAIAIAKRKQKPHSP
jgi:hypothetical protein